MFADARCHEPRDQTPMETSIFRVNPALDQSRAVIEVVPWSRQRGESLSGLPNASPLNDLQLVAFRETAADLMLVEQFGERLHV